MLHEPEPLAGVVVVHEKRHPEKLARLRPDFQERERNLEAVMRHALLPGDL